MMNKHVSDLVSIFSFFCHPMCFTIKMSIVRKKQDFQQEIERFSTYIECFKYFNTNSVVAKKKVARFLTVVGPMDHVLLIDFYSPLKPPDQTIHNLIQTLKFSLKPEPIIIAKQYNF